MELDVAPHPLLDARAFTSEGQTLGGESPGWLRALLAEGVDTPLARDEHTRTTVRDLLRHGGYKPTGRGKPASEYLARAASEGKLASINVAVDCANAVSLHSGLPVSVVDLDRTREPLRIALAEPGSRYVFNPAGQEIDVSGLPCLLDPEGPCANAVKDAQRTKTDATTRRTLSILWGHRQLTPRVEAALTWYLQLLERAGAVYRPIHAKTPV